MHPLQRLDELLDGWRRRGPNQVFAVILHAFDAAEGVDDRVEITP